MSSNVPSLRCPRCATIIRRSARSQSSHVRVRVSYGSCTKSRCGHLASQQRTGWKSLTSVEDLSSRRRLKACVLLLREMRIVR
ncbi:hypothetical protein PM082_016675 [Marasmius tenuissimus]|nr:hypothetical protein PM082_016675 [Marasmius tenuissimus]